MVKMVASHWPASGGVTGFWKGQDYFILLLLFCSQKWFATTAHLRHIRWSEMRRKHEVHTSSNQPLIIRLNTLSQQIFPRFHQLLITSCSGSVLPRDIRWLVVRERENTNKRRPKNEKEESTKKRGKPPKSVRNFWGIDGFELAPERRNWAP